MYVTAKLGRQRKEQRYLVSPTSDEGVLMVQSDKAIGTFDFRSRMGRLNIKGCYFPHLSPMLGAEEYEFPVEFVTECLRVCPALDSVISLGGGAVLANATVEMYR